MSVSEWHANAKTWALMTVKWTNDKVPIHSALQLDCNRKYNNKKWISYLHYHFHRGFFGNRIKSHFISATSTLRESVLPPASACRARKKLSAVIDLLAPNLILIQIFTYLQEACKHTLGVIYFAVGQTHCNALICLLSPKQREGKNKEDAVRLPDTWTPPLVSLYRSCWSQTDAKAETSEVYKVGLRSSGACGQKCKARRIDACMSVREWPRSLWSLKRWFEDDWTSLLATPRHFSFHSWGIFTSELKVLQMQQVSSLTKPFVRKVKHLQAAKKGVQTLTQTNHNQRRLMQETQMQRREERV